jgi:hypothetical protein
MTDATFVTRRLAIGAGKGSNIYLVNRDNIGKVQSEKRRRHLSGTGWSGAGQYPRRPGLLSGTG